MTGSTPAVPTHSATHTARRAPYWIALTIVAVAAVAAAVWWILQGDTPDATATPGPNVPSTSPNEPVGAQSGPTGEPAGELTAAQQLLATTDDPHACAVSFVGDGIAVEPILSTQGLFYEGLTTPRQDGQVFAGWYASPEAATALDQLQRINGYTPAACTNQEVTLYGAWMTPEKNAQAAAQIPILMYHQFTTNPEGEDNWLSANYVYDKDFDAHLAYIAEKKFYLPTWLELSDFIDGLLYLPEHSVIVTDDDADHTWLELAVPIVDKYQIPTTSFVIAIDGPGPELSQYVQKRSHTYDMHSAGDNGQGRLTNWDVDAVAADLEKSAQVIGGAKEVVAYPYGHRNDTGKEGLLKAGFILGRTVDQGYVTIGTDKLELPVVRINFGMGVDALSAAIG